MDIYQTIPAILTEGERALSNDQIGILHLRGQLDSKIDDIRSGQNCHW